MLNNLTDDLYSYLKARWWGKPLIGIVALCVLLFIVWNSLTAAQKETFLGGSQGLGVLSNVNAVGTSDRPITSEELAARNLVINTCNDVRDPRSRYEFAKQLESAEAREAEFGSLALEAVCSNDEAFAMELFARLSSSGWKDRTAKRVAETYLERRQYSSAQKWAAFLSNAQDREWWTRRILEESRKNG